MAVDSSKLLERDIGISKGAHITAPQVKMLKITKAKLGDVANNLKDNLVLTKVRNAAENKRRQEALRKKREAELENKKKKKTSGGGKGPKIPGMGMLDGIINGLITVLWGMLVVKALSWVNSPGFKKFFNTVVTVGKWIIKASEWLLESLVNLIDWGYKLYDSGSEWIKNTFGEEAAEKFQGFMDGVKSIVQAVIFVKVILKGAVDSIIKSVVGVFKKLGTVIKNAYKLAKFVINTAIKAAKLILKGVVKTVQTGAKIINWATRGRAGNLVNAAKKGITDFGSKQLDKVKRLGSKLNPKNWKAPKIKAPSWWQKGTSFISKKASQTKNLVSGAWGKLGNTLKEATKNLGKYIDDITGPLRKAGQNLGNSMKAGLDKLNPAKAIEKLKGKIKPVIQEMLEKNPFVKKIMSWMSGKSKGAVKWVLKNIKKIGASPQLKKLATGLKASKGSTKALGPVDKIITALMTLIDYAKFGESPINAILKGLGGLVGYGLGFTAAQAAIPVPGSGFLGGIAGSVLGEFIAHHSLKLLAKGTDLDEMPDEFMNDGRMLLRDPEDLGDHMVKNPKVQAGDDATDVSTTASYEEGGGEGSTQFIKVDMPNTNNSSGGTDSKTVNNSSSDSKENSGDPKLLLYSGK